MKIVSGERSISCIFVFIVMLANAMIPVYETAARLEVRMDERDMVIKCLMPKDAYTGSYKLDWLFRKNHGIITSCRPTIGRPCLPPSVMSAEWIGTHEFKVIPGGASLRINEFKNRTEDEEFTCQFYNKSDFSTEISFSVKSLYNTIQAGDSGTRALSTDSTLSAKNDDKHHYDNSTLTSILGALLTISCCILIVVIVYWCCKRRNTENNTDEEVAMEVFLTDLQNGNGNGETPDNGGRESSITVHVPDRESESTSDALDTDRESESTSNALAANNLQNGNGNGETLEDDLQNGNGNGETPENERKTEARNFLMKVLPSTPTQNFQKGLNKDTEDSGAEICNSNDDTSEQPDDTVSLLVKLKHDEDS